MPRECPDRSARLRISLTRSLAPVEDLSDEETGDIPFADAKEDAVNDNQSDADDDDEGDEEGV